MSWKSTNEMKEKENFIRMWESKAYIFSSLCESFGISRTTGYYIIDQYKKYGELIFEGRSKRPNNIPHKTPEKIEQSIIKLRQKHNDWGARKIKKLLEKEYSKKKIPSETTINAILKRNHLIKKKRRRYKKEGKLNPKFDPAICNEIWSSDYKGKFKLKNGRYCNPLTVCDSKSRKILGIKCHYKATYQSVKQSYIKVFREYGMPQYLHTDNGSPFGSIQAVRRFSRLCYWLIDHDVTPVFSDLGCPQQNGRHERMHRDLKAYCKKRIKHTLQGQQRIMDEFRQEYNTVRPHEALLMETPYYAHVKSEREFKERIKNYDYPIDYKILKVSINGTIRWKSFYWIYISRAATKRYVGIKEIGNGIWNVYYRDVILGSFDEKELYCKQQYLKLSKIKV